MIKRLAMAVGLMLMLGLPMLALTGDGASANHVPPPTSSEAAELCRQLDEEGVLDAPGNEVTRGECVNILTGPASENANNFIAGICGLAFAQESTGTTSKGQCIKIVRSFI